MDDETCAPSVLKLLLHLFVPRALFACGLVPLSRLQAPAESPQPMQHQEHHRDSRGRSLGPGYREPGAFKAPDKISGWHRYTPFLISLSIRQFYSD